MKYLLLCYHDERELADKGLELLKACQQDAFDQVTMLKANGKCLSATPLASVDVAKSVRVREGKRFVTDGPFAETREQLGGFYLLDVDSLDEALAIAQQQPGARIGTIEVRPVLEIPGLQITDKLAR
jgi:hypothetical protein